MSILACHIGKMTEEWEEVPVIVMVDEDGNEAYFTEEVQVEYDGKAFSVLVPITEDGVVKEEDDAVVVRVEKEQGEDVFLPPTEAEYIGVTALLETMDETEESDSFC